MKLLQPTSQVKVYLKKTFLRSDSPKADLEESRHLQHSFWMWTPILSCPGSSEDIECEISKRKVIIITGSNLPRLGVYEHHKVIHKLLSRYINTVNNFSVIFHVMRSHMLHFLLSLAQEKFPTEDPLIQLLPFRFATGSMQTLHKSLRNFITYSTPSFLMTQEY